jgi:beta-fructofuranosidase
MNRLTNITLAVLLLAPLAALHAADAPKQEPNPPLPAPLITSLNELLAKVDVKLVARCEAAVRAELDAQVGSRVGPILLTEERFTKKHPDGSVQVSQYWGRAPMQAYPFFDAYDLLGDEKYLRVALDLADYYLRIQEPGGFWHYAHVVQPDGSARRLEMAEAGGRAVCRMQDTHQTGCFRLMLYAWRVTGERKYLDAAKRCGDYVLSIQNENGSWPDWWIPGYRHSDPNPRQKAGVISGGSYNDGATTAGLEMTLVMYHLTCDAKYVARLPQLGQWIFDTQLGRGKVRGWCQQYDLDNKPAAARHFESPVIDPRTFGRFVAPLCAWFHVMSGEERYMTLMQETVDWIKSVENLGGWAYQYLADGTACFSLGGQVYRHDRPETWPQEFPKKHDGIQKFTRDNGGPGDALHFLAAWRKGTLKASFTGSVKLSPEEYTRARLSAAKWVAARKDATGPPSQFLMQLRTAVGRFAPEQLAAGAPPHLCGQGLHAFKVANWFEVPWPAVRDAASSADAIAAQDASRPVFHFRPSSQWMNDVCGAFFFKGWHHVFFQFNPKADTWGKGIGWGHARSRDFVHWELLPPALLPNQENGSVLDASGSAALDDHGRPVLFFGRTPPNGAREQWAALPEDDGLIRWRRVDIGLKPGQSGVSANIKPSWADMFVFAAGGRTFATFKSSGGLICEAVRTDLLAWKAVGTVEGIGGECPNLFPLQNRHVLVLSTEPISYRVGEFDAARIAFKPSFDGLRVLDHGPGPDAAKWNRGLYGTTVFTDAKGRSIFLGWISGFKPERGWNGCMSLPRVLSLDGNELIQRPIPELAELRGKKTRTFEGGCGEIIAEFKPTGDGRYGLRLGSIPVVCNGDRLNVAGTEVPDVRVTKLHIFFDRSVIEVFVNDGRRTVTKVVYPESNDLRLETFADAGTAEVTVLDAWELKPIW